MTPSLQELYLQLEALLRSVAPPLVVRTSPDGQTIECHGTKPVMQGRQQVTGHYFASLQVKPKDIRLYFFPIYTHPDQFPALSPQLAAALKGKSCFHLRQLSPGMAEELQALFMRGLQLYQADQLV